MAVSLTAEGTTVFGENIFENRFRHVAELQRMGADIKTEGRVAIVSGVKKLRGAPITATDLRGGAALIVAALGAEAGRRYRRDAYRPGIRHIARAQTLGAKVERVGETSAEGKSC
jgi:UDP-N-acetylglucosamine 1-carboxyvinyltransferase